MDRVAALVLAGGRGGDFGPLSEHRTKAAFPVGGYYRIIDFVLSNLSHSGIRQVGVVIQYLPASLMDHIGSGRPWDFDMADRRIRFMTPFVGIRETRWFHGTGDAIDKNLNLLVNPEIRDVLIISGDHIYRMDYQKLIDEHRERDADLTMACVDLPEERRNRRFGYVYSDEDGRVEQFIEKPSDPLNSIASMGIYCFKREVLIDLLAKSSASNQEDEYSLARDIIQAHVKEIRAYTYMFRHPWFYVADLQEYFDIHMRMAMGKQPLIDGPWDIITNFSDRHLGSRPPAYVAAEGNIDCALFSPGCRISGTVRNSILSPGVTVQPGAVVDHCIVFHDVKIGPDCRLEYAIIDKDVVLGAGASVGVCENGSAPDTRPITVVPKGYQVGPGEVIAPGAILAVPNKI